MVSSLDDVRSLGDLIVVIAVDIVGTDVLISREGLGFGALRILCLRMPHRIHHRPWRDLA